jgi:hypothetical protein
VSISQIAGYTYGTSVISPSPISQEEFRYLKQTVLFSEEDKQYLRMAGSILQKQTDTILNLWYNFIGCYPYLIQYSGKPNDKEPDSAFLGAVRQRFKQWILNTCNREYDQAWLDYQHEIGLRHHLTKKNQTDQVQPVPMIPLRYLIAFIYPITATIKDFLANQGHDIEAVEKIHQAWFKSIVLQVTLWSYPYTNPWQF